MQSESLTGSATDSPTDSPTDSQILAIWPHNQPTCAPALSSTIKKGQGSRLVPNC